MAITVYWASCDKNWMFQKKPDSVSSKLNISNLNTKSPNIIRMNRCPAFIDELWNTYNMYSLYDFEVKIDSVSQTLQTSYDQVFLNNHFHVRSLKDKLFSYTQGFIFFTDSSSLEASFCKFPFFEDNDITKRCKMIPGRFDIGRWFRPTEFAFYLKEPYDSFKVCKDDVFFYSQFHTKEKIILKQFFYSDVLRNYASYCDHANKFYSLIKLENYYKMFKTKKLILKEIQKNLID